MVISWALHVKSNIVSRIASGKLIWLQKIWHTNWQFYFWVYHRLVKVSNQLQACPQQGINIFKTKEIQRQWRQFFHFSVIIRHHCVAFWDYNNKTAGKQHYATCAALECSTLQCTAFPLCLYIRICILFFSFFLDWYPICIWNNGCGLASAKCTLIKSRLSFMHRPSGATS